MIVMASSPSRPTGTRDWSVSAKATTAGHAPRRITLSPRRMGTGPAVAQDDGKHAAIGGNGKIDQQSGIDEDECGTIAEWAEMSGLRETPKSQAPKSLQVPISKLC